MLKADVAKIVAKWKRIKDGEDTRMDSQGGQEPEGGIERQGSGQLQGRDTEAASEVGGQPKKGQLSGTDGGSQRTRARQQRKTNSSSSQPKSVGSLKQVGRKSKGARNQSSKQSKEG